MALHPEPEEASALSGLRMLSQEAEDASGSVLIICAGTQARFKLPNPLQGQNGEGAMVYYKGQWLSPYRFEKDCSKRKDWRRSFMVHTGSPQDKDGWVRMDEWLRRVNNVQNNLGIGTSGAEAQTRNNNNQSSSAQGGKRSTSMTDITPEAKRQRIEHNLREAREAEERAAAAAAAAAEKRARLQQQEEQWEQMMARLEQERREREAADKLVLELQEQKEKELQELMQEQERALQELKQKQKRAREELKQKQAQELQEPRQALQERQAAVEEAERAVAAAEDDLWKCC